jgi:hypothetical protein
VNVIILIGLRDQVLGSRRLPRALRLLCFSGFAAGLLLVSLAGALGAMTSDPVVGSAGISSPEAMRPSISFARASSEVRSN